MLGIQSELVRTVLRWQVIATAILAVVAGYLAGMHGAASALLGGFVSVAAALTFVVVASLGRATPASVEATLLRGLRAEAAKVATVVVLLWLVFSLYTQLVAVAFLGAFIVTVVIFSMAFFLRHSSLNR